jgi:hypothetical protein
VTDNVGIVADNVGIVTDNIGIVADNVGIATDNIGILLDSTITHYTNEIQNKCDINSLVAAARMNIVPYLAINFVVVRLVANGKEA